MGSDEAPDEEISTGVDFEFDFAPSVSGHPQKRVVRRIRRQRKDSCIKTVIEILAILCLLPLMNDMWIFPFQVVMNGGMAFFLAYSAVLVIFVHPTLCLVLFVSQNTQTGLVDVFRMYGQAYKGVVFVH
ncbi:hypothetical protein GCK32_015992 [Trichostrongylus colubriformis]|uniref:Uncharacterized protein n=1 Tax=Trichostrongylus colubriformis TaxID=6319 RepID=A0AAN8IHU7_TRICO